VRQRQIAQHGGAALFHFILAADNQLTPDHYRQLLQSHSSAVSESSGAHSFAASDVRFIDASTTASAIVAFAAATAAAAAAATSS